MADDKSFEESKKKDKSAKAAKPKVSLNAKSNAELKATLGKKKTKREPSRGKDEGQSAKATKVSAKPSQMKRRKETGAAKK